MTVTGVAPPRADSLGTPQAPALTRAAVYEIGGEALDERRLQLMADRVPGARWSTVLGLLFLAAIAWRHVPSAVVIGWFAVTLVAREFRAAAQLRMVADRVTPVAVRLRNTVLLALLCGVCFGAAALFMRWLDTTLDALVTTMLFALATGGLAVNSTYSRAYAAYATPILGLTALMWAVEGGWIGLTVTLMILLAMGMHIRFARSNQETFEESFRIRLENEALVRSLAAERNELERARDAAMQANLEKSRFLAAASHDLRQPLQSLTLNSGELARLPLASDARAMASDIGISVEQLRSMLDALLDLSKLDAGVVVAQPRRVRLALLVQAVVASFRAAAVVRGIGLEHQCPNDITVETDPDLLRRILSNLVDNAIKFTSSGAVSVQVAAGDLDVEIAVRDSGPGIAPEHHRLVFEDLVQLPGQGLDHRSGHGLGLGIVRRAAALLRVDIKLESQPGAGAVFRWRMPRAATQPGVSVAPDGVPSLVGKRFLVLDDDAMVRGAYANALAAAGAEICTAATIAEALRNTGQVNAAVIDWRLAEEGDGFTAIERLRERRPVLPVVMVTADTGPKIAEAAQRCGAVLLRKPVDASTLVRALLGAIAGPPMHETRSSAGTTSGAG